MKVLSFGEILWDVYPDKKCIGGAPLNFAAHLARHRVETYMLSALGSDELGKDALLKLSDFGISAKYVSFPDEKKTGRCDVTLNKDGVPSYNLLDDVAYDYIDTVCVDEDFDVIYFGTLALRSEYNFNSLSSLLASRHFAEVFVDINIRAPFYSKENVCFALENATILKVSDEELPVVAKMAGIEECNHKVFAKRLLDIYKNLKCIIITLGPDGACAFDTGGKKEYSCGASDVEVVSTVGAGDSFSAAFLYKYMGGCDIGDCLEYASSIAGFVVSRYEAIPEYTVAE